MAKIWDDENVSEYELLEQDAKEAEELAEEYAANTSVVDASEDQLEEISDEAAFELTKTESNVIYNARLRLEQAKLYELLINHNLFEGVDASPEAIKNVQNELKFYIVKRLEILLGIREPVIRVASATAEPQFNEIEVDFLKTLAYKGTFGQSQEASTPKPKPETPKPMALKPVTPAQKLKAMTAPKKVEVKEEVKPTPKPEVKKTAPAPQPTPPQVKKAVPAKPVQTPIPQQKQVVKKTSTVKTRPSGMGRDLTKEEAIEIAKADMATSSGKPFHEMTAKEKAAKIAEVNARNPRRAAPGAQPMPSADQIKMKYLTQQDSRANSRDQTNQFNSILATALAAKKNTGEYDGE